MGSYRIQRTFRDLKTTGRTGLIPFLTVGFPDVETTLELLPALAQAGADIIELGVPFSDPLADGTTVQKAGFHALRQGVTLKGCLEVCATLREGGLETPLVFMGYYNPLLSFGLRPFALQARDAGLDGLIVVDLPPEESGPLQEECRRCDIDLICLLAPTSTDERIAAGCAMASGFVYCVSVAGVTGARDRVSPDALRLVERVRAHTLLPIALGFGLSRPEHIDAVGQWADAAVIGSALVDVIDDAPEGEVVARTARFLSGLRREPTPSDRGTP